MPIDGISMHNNFLPKRNKNYNMPNTSEKYDHKNVNYNCLPKDSKPYIVIVYKKAQDFA